MRTSDFARRLRDGTRGRAALLLVPVMLFAPGPATGAPAEAPAAVPTCRGVPATIVGTDGNDSLVGTAGADVIVGRRGSDDISGGRGDDLICGGSTRPRFVFGDPIFQSLSGGPGADTVVGGRGPDEVFGGAGADMLIGNAGADFMNGGDGRDTLRGGLGRDNLNGNRRSDRIFGGRDGDFIEDPDGANAVMGGAGVDFIGSGPGDEAIDGGTGRDLVSYAEVLSGGGSSSHCHAITVDLSKGSASGAGFGADALHHVETVLTGGGSDVLIGDAAANGFYAGFPCFRGRSPTESVTGKGGADRVYFSEPLGGEGSSGRVLVDLQDHAAQLGNQGAAPVLYTLRSVENVTGTDLRDVILGNAGPNRLDGGPSNSGDVINGRRGDDVLIGNGGADQLDGGTGRNRNDGGNGIDTCLRPSEGALAINCEQ